MVASETYHFVLGSLILLRLFGFVIFFDFYRKNQEIRFLILSLAILTYAFSPVIDLFIQDIQGTSTYNFLFFISELATSLALILFLFVFFRYTTTETSTKAWLTILVSILIIAISYPIVHLDLGILLIRGLNLVLIIITILHIIRKWEILTNIADNSAYFFFVSSIAIIIVLIVGTVGDSPETDFIQYVLNVGISFLAIFIFVHLEYNRLSIQKFLMKDDYSHSVAQILQVLIGRLETSQLQHNTEEAKMLIEQAIEDCLRVGDTLTKIRKI